MSNRVKQLRESRGWTQSDLGERIGVGWQTVSRIENARTRIMPKHEKSLAVALEVPVTSLYAEPDSGQIAEDERDTVEVPLLARISASSFRQQDGVKVADIERHVKVSHLPKGDWFALTVEGDSMNRIAPDGSIIIVNRADDHLVDGGYYVFSLNDGAATFKKFKREPSPMLVPFSWSPDHYSIPIGDQDLYVFGRVKRIITDL
ncbi:LexA family transcriptional regulator [Aureimonas sp. SK2]|uniref:LexA family protein n=1 Tax=Aureimonas sp. SK2 TaxID=3015992 RepID=UPI002443D261|nr:S24 family peptidase [Aureimonas sp. SK2]